MKMLNNNIANQHPKRVHIARTAGGWTLCGLLACRVQWRQSWTGTPRVPASCRCTFCRRAMLR